VTVNLLRCALVLRLKLRLDVGRCFLVDLLTCTSTQFNFRHNSLKILLHALKMTSTFLTSIFGKADRDGDFLIFSSKEILLVEEENDGRVREPLVVADRIKQLQALHACGSASESRQLCNITNSAPNTSKHAR
jgi:hypothetical protein